MARKFAALLAGLFLFAGLTACGNDSVAYRPAAFGENNQCYYVEDPLEVVALQNAGLCPRTWAPTLMPLFWHQQYAYYYDYPGYYNTFVPVGFRTTYVTHVHTFEKTYASDIKSASKSAKFKGSNGKTVTGNKIKVGPKTFSGGSNKNGFSGGSNKSKTCGMSASGGALTLVTKGGGSTGGGFSGGGSRGGSSGGSRSSTTGGGSRSGTSGGSKSGTSGGSKTTSKTGGC